ncbi:hypothetical protein FRB90_009913 [Tulasnella sp. 427]|nr:hypothetical protein FRB90_009913 [Tulasnella sp. 427]
MIPGDPPFKSTSELLTSRGSSIGTTRSRWPSRSMYSTRQPAIRFEANRNDAAAVAPYKPVSFFGGTITVRIHEADETPYEHVLDIRETQNTTKSCSTPSTNETEYEARWRTSTCLVKQLLYRSDEGEWTKRRVTDWTEEDEQRTVGATYEWIRMDADFERIGEIAFDPPDFMWVSQLQRDLDGLTSTGEATISRFLTHTFLMSNHFYRVRMEAALFLNLCASEGMQNIGVFHLFKIFIA